MSLSQILYRTAVLLKILVLCHGSMGNDASLEISFCLHQCETPCGNRARQLGLELGYLVGTIGDVTVAKLS
jgi:hypothetical protein